MSSIILRQKTFGTRGLLQELVAQPEQKRGALTEHRRSCVETGFNSRSLNALYVHVIQGGGFSSSVFYYFIIIWSGKKSEQL